MNRDGVMRCAPDSPRREERPDGFDLHPIRLSQIIAWNCDGNPAENAIQRNGLAQEII